MNIQWTGLTLLQEGEVHRQNKKTMGGDIGRNIHSLGLEKSVSGSSKFLRLPDSQN